MELRLLTEPAFIEEFDTVVEEITDQYVGDELDAEERKRVKDYFLQAVERRNKVKLVSALADHAKASREEQPVETPTPAVVENPPTLLERFVAFLNPQSFAFRAATVLATLVVVAGIVYIIRPGSQTFTPIELTISYSDRGEGAAAKSVKLAPDSDGLRIRLNLPEQAPQSSKYKVELVDEKNVKRDLEIVEQDAQSVTAVAPASALSPGRYGLHLSTVDASGTPQRLHGTYRFNIE